MMQLLILFLAIGGLLQSSVALPQPSAPAGNPDLETDARAKNNMRCTIFNPPEYGTTSQMQCQNVCGDAVAKNIAAGQTASVICYAFGEVKWETFSGV